MLRMGRKYFLTLRKIQKYEKKLPLKATVLIKFQFLMKKVLMVKNLLKLILIFQEKDVLKVLFSKTFLFIKILY